ncbi:amino acid adenylation domain-containing protein [Stutzerimonas zhaodongensis]|jgi:amino acid adenylation domain-containing protein|uniref:amino acid adenylation domain-containing protein n=1 Tax=Stutzerimonas zhaodongensis TaxID=1176257 RepID=UPI001F4D4E51|nr:amino acid adenylation domain-containing protein [Stutzerimonas zhaodongensis]UNG16763.1 amino acid adenylation domain-containing protein [Stutzerimonas zhaodongensis]
MRPLGIAQQGLWSGYLLNEDRAMFNTAECIAFAGKIHETPLIAAVRHAVQECEALSGVFVAEDDAVFFEPCELPVVVQRVQVPAGADAERWVRDWAMRDIRVAIDLQRELPCRFALLQAEGRDFLYSCVHHIALDGYGTNLLYQRIAELYGALVKGDPAPASGFGRYEDVLQEDAERDAQGRTAAARGYWLEALSQMPEPASFSERSAPISATFIRHEAPFTAPLWRALNQVAEAQGVGWPDLLLAGVSAHLRQVSGTRAQVLGLMVMNRIGSASFNVPCMQMNIAPLCLDLPDDADLIAGAKAIGKLRRSSRKHQHYRYESLRRDLGRIGGEQRLFGPLINIMPFDRPLTYGDCPARTLNLSAGPVEDLTLEVQIGADGIPVLDYDANPACYSLDQVRGLQAELFDLLECWLAEPQQPRSVLLDELFAVRRAWQVIKAPDNAIHVQPSNALEAIRLQAESRPDHTALIQHEQAISYGELQARAEMVAAALVDEGIEQGQRIGVMLSRSPQAILAQMGVLLAGAVYVPLDPEQPADRQRLICETADLALVITEAAYRHRLADIHAGPIQLIGLLTSANRICRPRDNDAACYLMFTSGSTGAPKGVEISHRALAHFAQAARQRYGIGSADRVLQFAPFNFDASIEEVFVSLSAGATLVLRTDPMLQSMAAFVEGLEQLAISVVDLPTAFWNEWVVALRSGQVQIPPSLKTVIIGGEAVYPEQLQAWQRMGRPDVRLINTYGPTETTVVASTCDLQALDPNRERLPIGRPLAGVESLVLERGNRPGSEGELVLFGAQLANGYLNSDSPAFAHLRIGDETTRVYRTGDRVRLVDGLLVYLGRLDNEFKISGYRIQPGEVEARMLALPGIDEACVLGLELDAGVRRLVAFFAGPRDDARAVKRELSAVLPAAMVPTDYRHFAVLPRTGSNKIDRKRLQQAYVQGTTERALNDDTQRRVSAIWQQILGVSGIQPEDNFFELGGQSLQTIQIVNRLGAEFGTAVKVSDVFDHPQLADFCSFLDSRLQQREELVEMVW